MPDPILTQSRSIQLTGQEWSELQDCATAFHACIEKCCGLEGDEGAELLKSVYLRFSRSMTAVNARLEGDLD